MESPRVVHVSGSDAAHAVLQSECCKLETPTSELDSVVDQPDLLLALVFLP